MAKNFRTIEELIEILESRGVITDKETAPSLERESYYAIVNGYKKPFLDTKAMESSADDVYLEGTEFRWLYDLFLFDRDLRIVLFKYLTVAEAVMRTAVSYAFCEAHQEENAYLNRENFCDEGTYLVPKSFKGNKSELYTKNLNSLMRRLNSKLEIKSDTRDFIKHYVKVHKTVPLWVLSNDLTFGNIVHFYQLMQEKDRRRVCSLVANVSERKKTSSGTLSERRLLRSATLLYHFRNLCAHDERLYCARYDTMGLSDVVNRLGDFLTVAETGGLIDEMSILYVTYKDRLHNMGFDDLLIEMGYPEDLVRRTTNQGTQEI